LPFTQEELDPVDVLSRQAFGSLDEPLTECDTEDENKDDRNEQDSFLGFDPTALRATFNDLDAIFDSLDEPLTELDTKDEVNGEGSYSGRTAENIKKKRRGRQVFCLTLLL
jgi:hypothetical protein